MLEHRNVQVGERIVALAVEAQVLAVLEFTACEQDGKIHIGVGIRTAHAGAVQNHGTVEQRAVVLFGRGKGG